MTDNAEEQTTSSKAFKTLSGDWFNNEVPLNNQNSTITRPNTIKTLDFEMGTKVYETEGTVVYVDKVQPPQQQQGTEKDEVPFKSVIESEEMKELEKKFEIERNRKQDTIQDYLFALNSIPTDDITSTSNAVSFDIEYTPPEQSPVTDEEQKRTVSIPSHEIAPKMEDLVPTAEDISGTSIYMTGAMGDRNNFATKEEKARDIKNFYTQAKQTYNNLIVDEPQPQPQQQQFGFQPQQGFQQHFGFQQQGQFGFQQQGFQQQFGFQPQPQQFGFRQQQFGYQPQQGFQQQQFGYQPQQGFQQQGFQPQQGFQQQQSGYQPQQQFGYQPQQQFYQGNQVNWGQQPAQNPQQQKQNWNAQKFYSNPQDDTASNKYKSFLKTFGEKAKEAFEKIKVEASKVDERVKEMTNVLQKEETTISTAHTKIKTKPTERRENLRRRA